MKRLYSNLSLKLLALAFAVLFWLLASNREVAETTVRVSLKLIPTGDYTVISYEPRKVELTVEGFRKEILSLKEKKQVQFLLPKELKNGVNPVTLRKDSFLLPNQSLRIRRVEPKTIKVNVELLSKKLVKVVPQVELPPNATVKTDPNYVVMLLPEEIKEVIDRVKTEKIDASGVKPPADFYLKLQSNYKVFPKEVKVEIRERRKEK
jgi:hypothetical protein